ncbi:energy transducer TonB [Fluviicola sp.]|uniref:energy transducer TonB n=1 Tax=Fluviicola sp. TaxID=1917219 RepID=UPI0031DA6264
MKSLFFSLLIIGSFTVSAQLPKKQRRLLTADCALEYQKQEEAIAVFSKSRAEFDSVKMLANSKILSLENGAKKVLDRFTTYSGLLYQVEQLQAEVPPLLHSFKPGESPVPYLFMEPLKSTLATTFVFEKVPEKTDMGDLSVKEQNKVLKKKLEEYKRYSLSNAIRLEEMKATAARIKAFLMFEDSVTRVYTSLANDLTSDSWKLQDRLNQEEDKFRKKGPAGFPEAYFLVFPEVFPGFIPTRPESIANNATIQEVIKEYPPDMVVEHNDPEIFEWTEDPAEFPGGKEALDQFIAKNLEYPVSVREGIVFGKVVMKFVVSVKGEISAIEVLRGIPGCPECGEEAVRLINSMPNWTPAKHQGKAVRSYMRLPVNFEL